MLTPASSHRSSASPTALAVSDSVVEEEAEGEEENPLLCRIQSGIKYVLKQHQRGETIMQTTCLETDISKASSQPALSLLQRYGILIYSSPRFEVFELGVPRPDWVGWPSLHGPQWWMGLRRQKAGLRMWNSDWSDNVEESSVSGEEDEANDEYEDLLVALPRGWIAVNKEDSEDEDYVP